MWTKESLQKLWVEVIVDFKERFPEYSDLLREARYRPIVVDKKANYFGQCDNRKKTVCVNLHLYRNGKREHIMDTMLHEIAHAVDYCKNGRSSRHGKPWQLVAEEIGCTPKATSKLAWKVEYPYVMCLQTEDELRFVKGYNRKPPRTPIGKYIEGTYLKSDKKGTMNKLIVYPWKTWCEHCKMYGISFYKEG